MKVFGVSCFPRGIELIASSLKYCTLEQLPFSTYNEIAVNVSIGIMKAFVEMRRFIANNALLFERISNVELKQLEYQKQTDESLTFP